MGTGRRVRNFPANLMTKYQGTIKYTNESDIRRIIL